MRSIEDMVSAEVRCCVSYLIPELVKSDSSEWYDDLLSICRQDDYRSAAEDKGWRVMERDDGISVIVNGDQIYDPGNECVDDIGNVCDYADYEVDDPDDLDVWRSLKPLQRNKYSNLAHILCKMLAIHVHNVYIKSMEGGKNKSHK